MNRTANSFGNDDIIVQAQRVGKQVTINGKTTDILKDVSLHCEKGETIAIVGKSGSGKSTLLGLLAGLDQPDSGSIHLFGQHLNILSEDQRAKQRAGKVGFVFQNFQLLDMLTVLENVMLPLELAGEKNGRAIAIGWLEKVGLGDRLDQLPSSLSGGEQQRVALARAFVTQPAILFADEPTGNLDGDTGQAIIELLFALQTNSQTALIIVTHDDQLASRCQRQLLLQKGELVN
ncbi:ATP-binding cassette domain-containing protein [Leeia sp. TBRC 13508]|uniref:ATP-binding cassette domain-containing protein n=1 Tax=Leeia speluncae TaxID=2884804 RepID=A0ABS8D6L9_9NEIS|nr:ATP-binding cassette domain-containing protein [Leeia speluncae]MCB6183848.1 ATP-binding cassette domain-containing protein [Leeia speluncae]